MADMTTQGDLAAAIRALADHAAGLQQAIAEEVGAGRDELAAITADSEIAELDEPHRSLLRSILGASRDRRPSW